MKGLWSAFGIAVLMFGCENRNATNRSNTSTTDTTSAQREMQDAQKDMAQAQSDANKKAADAQKEANQEKADAQQKMRDAQAKAGQPVTITGTVADVSDDSFRVKTPDGQSLDLKFTDDSGRVSPIPHSSLKEGDQVRASYTEHDGDKILQEVKVIQPSQEKSPDLDQNQNQNR
jgi:ATP-dependent 26S proteasome regulatory subunit